MAAFERFSKYNFMSFLRFSMLMNIFFEHFLIEFYRIGKKQSISVLLDRQANISLFSKKHPIGLI